VELAAIHLARSMAFVEPLDLNPHGRVYYPDLVTALVNRYGFKKFPEKPEDFDEVKGVTFVGGKFGGVVLEQFVIYRFGLALDTRVSTAESKRLLEEAMIWGKEIGLVLRPVPRWQYVSQITFHSKALLTCGDSAFTRLADSTSKAVSEVAGENVKYELIFASVDHDPLTRKHPLGRFSIQRRENTPFSENKYFSDAPLQTDVHIKLLERFEADILGE
jgi:hypothetical protein